MSNMNNFENFEKETKLELIRLEDSTNKSSAKKILESLNEEFEKWFNDIKKFIVVQKDNDSTKEVIEKVKIETAIILEKTKEKLESVKEDEKVKDIIDSTKKTINDVMDSINESDTFNKMKNNVSDTIETIKNDENLKKGVKKAKKVTLNFAEKALSGIQKALKEEEDETIVHHQNKED